jgi:hypothetical protein
LENEATVDNEDVVDRMVENDGEEEGEGKGVEDEVVWGVVVVAWKSKTVLVSDSGTDFALFASEVEYLVRRK